VVRLPFPSGIENRQPFDRVYALAAKVADGAIGLVAYGDKLIAGLKKPPNASAKGKPGSQRLLQSPHAEEPADE
jgi:hypothetical protein